MGSPTIQIYQIFYNEQTRQAVDPLYIPLDNTQGPKEWFEFYPIRQFLEQNELKDNTYYGFLSPKFFHKTQVHAQDLIHFINEQAQQAPVDAFLSSLGLNALSYYQNMFEQAETAHPGIKALSQRCLNAMGIPINLDHLVSTNHNAVFCNYIIANKTYWSAWKVLADKFYHLVENDTTDLGMALRADTDYLGDKAAMRTFIQERFPSLILANPAYKTRIFGHEWQALEQKLFYPEELAHYFKQRYLQTHDPMDLAVFKHLTHLVQFNS